MGQLQTDIDEYNAAKKEKFPAKVLNTMAQATQDLKSLGIEDRALAVGDKIPDFSLPNQKGEMRNIADLYSGATLVLNIYRGGWCPYCNFEMKALSGALPDIQAQGATLVGMAPETPDHARDTVTRHEINIEVLSDAGNRVSEQLGLVFELPEALRPMYQSAGIDIPAFNGDDSFRLPVPATYIIGTDGIVKHAFVDADYTRRMEPEDILSILKSL